MKLLLLLSSAALVCAVQGRLHLRNPTTGQQRPTRPPPPPPPPNPCDMCGKLLNECEGAKELLECVIINHHNHTEPEEKPPMEKRQMDPDHKKYCQMAALEVCHACQKHILMMHTLEECGVSPPEPPTPGPIPEPEPMPMEKGMNMMKRFKPCRLCRKGMRKCDGAKELAKCVRDHHKHHKEEEEEEGMDSSSEEEETSESESESKRAASDSTEDDKRQVREMEGDCRVPVLQVCHVCHKMKKMKRVFKKCGLKKPRRGQGFQRRRYRRPRDVTGPMAGEDHICIMCHNLMEQCNGAAEFVKCVVEEHHRHHNKTEEIMNKREMEMQLDMHGPECKLVALGVCHACHRQQVIHHLMEECKAEEPTPSPEEETTTIE